MNTLEISLPCDLAEQLVREGIVRRALRERGDLIGIATLAANAMSALATVVVNWDDLRLIIGRFADHASHEAGDQPTLTVTVSMGEESTTLIDANDTEGIGRIEVEVRRILSSDRPPSGS